MLLAGPSADSGTEAERCVAPELVEEAADYGVPEWESSACVAHGPDAVAHGVGAGGRAGGPGQGRPAPTRSVPQMGEMLTVSPVSGACTTSPPPTYMATW
jgi:hypothetical protein